MEGSNELSCDSRAIGQSETPHLHGKGQDLFSVESGVGKAPYAALTNVPSVCFGATPSLNTNEDSHQNKRDAKSLSKKITLMGKAESNYSEAKLSQLMSSSKNWVPLKRRFVEPSMISTCSQSPSETIKNQASSLSNNVGTETAAAHSNNLKNDAVQGKGAGKVKVDMSTQVQEQELLSNEVLKIGAGP